mmetsp:Transcript_34417/g.109024  ORF Transcript_34417/g.109024 Transcript_34417/m.109024 type:complete len:102 (-) Transcript_34417:120-425(-)
MSFVTIACAKLASGRSLTTRICPAVELLTEGKPLRLFHSCRIDAIGSQPDIVSALRLVVVSHRVLCACLLSLVSNQPLCRRCEHLCMDKCLMSGLSPEEVF